LRTVVLKQTDSLLNRDSIITSDQYPVYTPEDYEARFQRARSLMSEFDFLVIYADREHFSNVEYFTGFDPRFEEALLVIPKEGKPSLLVGNEGWDYAKAIKPHIHIVLYAPFSLPGQPRGSVQPLFKHLENAGILPQSSIGLVGWKAFTLQDGLSPEDSFDIPHFIVKALEKAAPQGQMKNATNIMVGNGEGLRITLEDKDLITSELAGSLVSRNVHRVLSNLQEGITELDASQAFQISGLPMSIHCNLNFGHQLDYAIASPTPREAVLSSFAFLALSSALSRFSNRNISQETMMAASSAVRRTKSANCVEDLPATRPMPTTRGPGALSSTDARRVRSPDVFFKAAFLPGTRSRE